MNKDWDIYYLPTCLCRKPRVITINAENKVKALFKAGEDIGIDAVVLNIFEKGKLNIGGHK